MASAVIDFNLEANNQLLVNPKISNSEKATLQELKKVFEGKFSDKGYFLIASSGSSQKVGDSVKLIALKIQSVLNSARRFNQYFEATAKVHWGLVLPEYHVAGLGVFARAYLSGAQVYSKEWMTDGIEAWFTENQVGYMSLVPAQIYDLVQANIKAPLCIKKVFVGASALNPDLRDKALTLQWPIIETYGMTETASMIAIKTDDFFKVLPGVEVDNSDGVLKIKCDSLLSAKLQKTSEDIEIQSFNESSWYVTQDKVEIKKNPDGVFLHFLGRDTDYIKILGEGVSLSELRDLLIRIALEKKLNPLNFEILAVGDERAGHKLVLTTEESVSEEDSKLLKDLFNQHCRPYEKIQECMSIGQIPRTELGKLKMDVLKHIVMSEIGKV